MNKTLSLTEGRVPSVLLKFSLPFLLASLLQTTFGAADVYFVGNYASATAISGVSAGNTCMMLVNSLFMGLTMGGTVLLGQYVGAKMEKDAAKTIGNVILVFAAIAAFTTVVLLVFGRALISLLGVPPEAVSEANTYLTICAIGATFIMGYNIVSAILRGLGNSIAPLYFVLIASVLHILLNILLVAIIPLGVAGAAISTVASQGVSLVISLIYIRKKGLPFPFVREDIHLEKAIVKRIFKIGIPVSLQFSLVVVSFMIIARITNSMGVAASAGVGVVGTIMNFGMMIPNTMGSAITTITAQNIGAGFPARALKTSYWGVLFSLCIAVPFCLIVQIWPEAVMSLMTKDPEVIRQGALYLIPYSFDSVLVSFVFCLSGMFSGVGKTMFVMIHNLATTFAVRIPIAFIASQTAGATLLHVGLGTPTASFVSAVACIIFLRINFSHEKLDRLTIVQ